MMLTSKKACIAWECLNQNDAMYIVFVHAPTHNRNPNVWNGFDVITARVVIVCHWIRHTPRACFTRQLVIRKPWSSLPVHHSQCIQFSVEAPYPWSNQSAMWGNLVFMYTISKSVYICITTPFAIDKPRTLRLWLPSFICYIVPSTTL